MNEQPTVHDVLFRIWCSYWLEDMTFKLNDRIDTAINALLLIFGASVFAQSHFSGLFGAMIAVLSGIRVAWHFGRRAESARQQKKRYSTLIDEAPKLTADELGARLATIEEFDSVALNCMNNPARNRASIAMALKHRERLSGMEKFIAMLTGGIPH